MTANDYIIQTIDVEKAVKVLQRHGITAEQYRELTKPEPIVYAPPEPPTRDELIQICADAIVPQEHWRDRDSARAHMQLGEALALLTAGCDFDVVPDGKTFQVHIQFRGFDWFEGGFGEEDRYLSNERYYIPTRARLDEVDGKDWYC